MVQRAAVYILHERVLSSIQYCMVPRALWGATTMYHGNRYSPSELLDMGPPKYKCLAQISV